MEPAPGIAAFQLEWIELDQNASGPRESLA